MPKTMMVKGDEDTTDGDKKREGRITKQYSVHSLI